MEPKPYQYGLVGHALAPDPASPPHSPSLLPVVHAGADLYSPQSRHEQQRSALPPLNVPATTSTPGLSVTTNSSRPSTGGSTQPLRPSSQQGLLQRPEFGRNISAGATSQFHQQSSSSSTATTSFSNRNLSPDRGTGYGAGTAAIGMAVLAGHDPSRSGSPASVVEQPARRLTVANATSPESGTFLFHDSSSSSVAPPAAAVATAVPQRDGKGRLRTIPPKAPIIHLDGGRVQARMLTPHGAGGSSPMDSEGPFPPEYEA
jgi:hypothetical protein